MNSVSENGSSIKIKTQIADRFLDGLDVALWVFDIDNSCVLWGNAKALEVWAAESIEELASRDMKADMSVSVSQRLRQYQEDFEQGDAAFTELWTLYPNGKPATLRVIYKGYRLDDGRMAMLCEASPELGETPETLRSAEALLHTTVMISLYADNGKPLYQNPAARASNADTGQNAECRFADRSEYRALMQRLRRDGKCRAAARIRTKNGVRWHEITARECSDAVTGGGAILFSEVDVSDLKQSEERVRYLADHDVLTGLPNRNFLQTEAPYRLADAKQAGKTMTLLLLDLDRFKEVNDTLGHAAGDELLIEVARRLQTAAGSNAIVSRLGGDEFIILVDEDDANSVQGHIGCRVLELFDDKIWVNNNELRVTPSIGMSEYPKNGKDLSSLMINADLALYAAKEAGKNRAEFFSVSLQSKLDDRLELEADLRRAMKEEQFELYYQPKIDVQTELITGAEALIRWHHPEKGLLNPQMFITTCEEIGIISEIGEWVITSVAQKQCELAGKGFPVSLSLNMSPRQFREPRLIDLVLSLARDTGCDPSMIEFEITESILMDEQGPITEYLETFKEIGYGIAIDDFGTGYSNLAYIQKYPISSLKIDRFFVSSLPDNSAITHLIIAMCKMMNLKSVAEGVETEEQLDWLRAQGCSEYQGFLFSPAVAPDEFAALLARQKTQATGNLVKLPTSRPRKVTSAQ